MIRVVRGEIVEIRTGSVVVDVQGIGYLLHVQSGKGEELVLGEKLLFHTHLVVREDSLSLYGFSTTDELELFEQLIELPKIGPKSALQILSQAPIELIKKAVASDDPEQLSKMSGIGRKTSEKIVTGLKDVLGHVEQFGVRDKGDSDVIDALVTLGYSHKEARDTVLRLDPSHSNTNARIREALRVLSK